MQIARSELEKAEGAIELRNPLSEDHVALRTSLIPGLLGALARNIRAGAERIALFEIGNVFTAPGGEQKRMLAIVLHGDVASKKNWRGQNQRRFDFFHLKGVIEFLASPGNSESFTKQTEPWLQSGGRQDAASYNFRRTDDRSLVLAAEVFAGEKRLGICGQLAAVHARALGAAGTVLVAELDLGEIARTRTHASRFTEIERFPAIRRDIAMFIAPTLTHEQILRVIASAKEPLLERVELFDLFSEKNPEKAGKARKSLAYSLTYRDKNRTLTNEEVNAAHARIRERLRMEIDAELRE